MSDEKLQDNEDENDSYLKLINFKSIRNSQQLEEAISVQWKSQSPLLLSTLLRPDDLAPLFAGAQWAGTRVWHAAIAAIQYITSNEQLSCNSRLLELGCGLGVPGMILYQIYKCHVCLTDQESILSQLQQNIQHNFPKSGKDKLQARALSWSKEGVSDLLSHEEAQFDMVLSCDCVYEPLYGSESIDYLVECMEELIRRHPSTRMLTSVERRAADGVDRFLNLLRASPYVSSVDLVFSDADYCIEIYSTRGILAT